MQGAKRYMQVEISTLHLNSNEYVQVSAGEFDTYILFEFKVSADGTLEIRTTHTDITLLPFEEDK